MRTDVGLGGSASGLTFLGLLPSLGLGLSERVGFLLACVL